VTRFLEVN